MKAKTQGVGPLFTQACIVPRCTTMSPGFICTVSPLSSSRSHSPEREERVVERFGAVHEFGRAGCEFGDADDRALAAADVIVALDKARTLRRLGLVRGVVDR